MLDIKRELHLWDLPKDLYVELYASFRKELFKNANFEAAMNYEKDETEAGKLKAAIEIIETYLKGFMKKYKVGINQKAIFSQLDTYRGSEWEYKEFLSDFMHWLEINVPIIRYGPFNTKRKRMEKFVRDYITQYKIDNYPLVCYLTKKKEKYGNVARIGPGGELSERGRMIISVAEWAKGNRPTPMYVFLKTFDMAYGKDQRKELEKGDQVKYVRTGSSAKSVILGSSFPIKLTEEKSSNISWLLGHLYGKCKIEFQRNLIVQADYGTKELENANKRFQDCLEKIFGKDTRTILTGRKTRLSLTLFAKILAEWWDEKDDLKEKFKTGRVPELLLSKKRSSLGDKRGFLQAYFEDYASVWIPSRGDWRGNITIKSNGAYEDIVNLLKNFDMTLKERRISQVAIPQQFINKLKTEFGIEIPTHKKKG